LEDLIASTGVVTTDMNLSQDGPQSLDIRAYTSQIKNQISKLEEECAHDFMNLND